MREPFKIFTPQGQRIVGFLADIGGRLLLIKRVQRARHFHQLLQAWATDKTALLELHRRGGWGLRLEVDDGSVIEAPVARILKLAIEKDYGYGTQLFLRECYWDVVRPGHGRPAQLTFGFIGTAGEAV